MSNIDQSRAYIDLKDKIKSIREEFGEDAAWRIVEMAVVANLYTTFEIKQKKEIDHA